VTLQSFADSLTTRALAALALGLAVGVAALAWPSAPLLLLVRVADPIGTVWVNAIRMTVIPLVVSLLITSVCSSGEARMVRTLGLRAIAVFIALLVFTGVVGLIVVPPLFSWLHVDPSAAAALRGPARVDSTPASVPGFADWLVGVVPANPIKAAADGAMLPLVVFTCAFALALLTIRVERREPVVTLFRGVADAMLAIVHIVIAFTPLGVFALMLSATARTGLAAAGALGYYIAVTAVAQTIMIALLYPVVAVAARIRPAHFARGVFPAQAVAFSSSSSLASLPTLIEGASDRLNLPASVTGLVLPLAVASFKIGGPLLWPLAALFLGRLYGVPLTTSQLVVVTLTGLLTSFSAPGVPHGWLLVLAPLVASMGIPAEGVGLLIAVDAVPDMFATTLNVTGDMAAAAIVARTQREASQPIAEAAIIADGLI
jgi:Na+/H+-dicarboxylate symporter